jgi:hypothetical protein
MVSAEECCISTSVESGLSAPLLFTALCKNYEFENNERRSVASHL